MNQSVGYAVTALLQLAAHQGGDLLSCTTMCERAGMPDRFVLQILRKLVNAGIVSSVRGVNGGYRLAKPIKEITFLEVAEAVDGPLLPPNAEADGLTAASQKLIGATLLGIADDARRRLGGFTLDRLHVR